VKEFFVEAQTPVRELLNTFSNPERGAFTAIEKFVVI
jgi:hypothetical protein